MVPGACSREDDHTARPAGGARGVAPALHHHHVGGGTAVPSLGDCTVCRPGTDRPPGGRNTTGMRVRDEGGGMGNPRWKGRRLSAMGLTSFMASGACREHDPELFFPVSGEDTDKGEMEWVAAKRICEMECPVRQECLFYALDNRPKHLVWGGRSEDERRGMRRRQQPARARVTI